MAHFYGDLQGSRGQATRLGTKKSGINGHIRGWQVGVKVNVNFNESTSEDEATVYLTSGSNGNKPSVYLGKFTKEHLTQPQKPPLDDVFAVLEDIQNYICEHQGQRARDLRQRIYTTIDMLERMG